jgi:hypothetical protein
MTTTTDLALLPSEITLTTEDYLRLASAALTSPDLRPLVQKIEAQNKITRDFVWVRWAEKAGPPPTQRFPEEWPKKQQHQITLVGRKVAKADVQEVLKWNATRPYLVMTTRDPKGVSGWAEFESMFP